MNDKTSQPEAGASLPASALRRHVHSLVWILVVGGLVRVLLLPCFSHQPLAIWDEREYNELAINLATRGEFRLNEQVISMRPPLYPAIVAGIYKLTGLESHQVVRLFQIVVDLMTVVVLYRLGVEVYNRRIGLLAAGLYAVYPSAVAQVHLLLTETLFTFWLVLACLLVVRALRRDSLGGLALAGVVIGLASLTRSVFWLLPPVLAVYVLVVWRTRFARRLAAVGLMLLAFAGTIAPWSIRCTRLEKTFVAIDTMGGRNFMMGNYEYTPLYRAWDAISIEGEQAWHHILARQHPGFDRLTQGERDKLALRYGLRFAWNHPGLTLKRDVVKFFNFWQLERAMIAGMDRGLWGELPHGVLLLTAGLILGAYIVVVFSGLLGVTITPPEDWRSHGVFLVVIALVCGVHTLVFGHSRYHLPLMPLVLLYAASALATWRGIWQSRRSRRFAVAIGLIAVLTAGWAWELVAADSERIVGLLKGLTG